MGGEARDDAATLVSWVREAADEIEKAHALLDTLGVARSLTQDEIAAPCTLAARIMLMSEVL